MEIIQHRLTQQAWLIRFWRKDAQLRQTVLDDLHLPNPRSSSPPVSEPSTDVDSYDDVVNVASTFSTVIEFPCDEWSAIKPALTKRRTMKMVDWTQAFC